MIEKETKYEAEGAPKLAMIDLGAEFSQAHAWDNSWKDPKLDGPRGAHNGQGQDMGTYWWSVDLKGDDVYEASSMILQKRGDGCCSGTPRVLTAVQFQYSLDHGLSWIDHEDGKWFETGQLPEDGKDVKRTINIEPPMHGNAFRVKMDDQHRQGSQWQGRFDIMVAKMVDPNAKLAMIDFGAKFSGKNFWDSNW